jgi:S-adenosylmethionine:tRNA ribosyltransferase-isomerase
VTVGDGSRLSDYDYDLPAELVASRPAEPRDAARLLVVPRGGGRLEDRVFRDLPGLLDPGDLLVLNDTRVIPARLAARRADTGGAVEVLLLRDEGGGRWRAMLDPARRLRPGVRLAFEGGSEARVEAVHEGGDRTLAFAPGVDVLALAEASGAAPLPPYLRRPADARDRDDYQTVYARAPGAVAAPTAGLHLTPALLDALRARGVHLAWLTLHVGPGTFRPVRVEAVSEHRMDAEPYEVPAATAAAVGAAWDAGRRVVAVGTTTTRALEAAAVAPGRVREGLGSTDLFIRPGHAFRAVTSLVTNFHLPKSTLLMLVSALAGRERVLAAYAHAVASRYRFYSYGDAMLLP